MKITHIVIANYYGLTRQTIASYKKNRPKTYNALVAYFISESK